VSRLGLTGRPVAALVAEGFLSRLSFGIVSFALPLFALQLGMSLAEIGLLISFNMIVAVVLKPPMGWVADRFGLRSSLIAAIWLRSAVSLLLVFASAPWQLFAIRGLHGVSIALRDPAVNALIAEVGGKRAIASSFAWYQTAKSVAGSVGRTLAGILITLTGSRYPLVFAVACALSALPLAVAVRALPASLPALAASAPGDARTATESGRTRPPMPPYVGLGFLVSGTAYMMANLFPILATEYAGLSAAAAGSIYALGALAALSGPLWGWLADRVSHTLVLSVRTVGNIFSSVIWLLFPTYGGLAAGRALDDLGKAAFRPAWGALMAHVSSFDRARRARIMSYLSAGEDAGEAVGPIVAGVLWSAFGIPAVLGVRIGLAVAAEIYTVVLTRRFGEPFAAPARAEPGVAVSPSRRLASGPLSSAARRTGTGRRSAG
jgi:MFS family permease